MRLSLTRRAEYGVRMMVELALHPTGTRMTATELGEACQVPAGNIPTVVSALSRAHLLMCSPGRGGGCSLAKDPADTSMLEVIEALEGSLTVDHCLLDSRRCHDVDPECALHESWSAGRTAALDALAGASLASAAKRERELREAD
ncbi:MAG: Rrf2 family transcriptional regulator [Acidimicrobiia bacterium]